MGMTVTPLSEASSDAEKIDETSGPLLHEHREQTSPIISSASKEPSVRKRKDENAIRLVFEAMRTAKVLQRHGLKETRDSNRMFEQRWDVVVIEIQEQHNKTAASQKSMSKYYFVAPTVQVAGMVLGQYLHNKCYAPPAVAGGALPRTQWTTDRIQNAQDFSNWFYTRLQGVTSIVPNTVEFVLDMEDKTRKAGDLTGAFNGIVSPMIQSQTEQLRTQNEAAQAPLNMKSQAYTSKHQNNGSDESAEKQQLSENDRLMRELMQQESQVFQGSNGRG